MERPRQGPITRRDALRRVRDMEIMRSILPSGAFGRHRQRTSRCRRTETGTARRRLIGGGPRRATGACYTLVKVRSRRFAVAAIVAICIGTPIVEMFDQWDHTLQDGNDTEANVAVAALCIGVGFAIGTIVVVTRIRALSSSSRVLTLAPATIWFPATSSAPPIPTGSPPIPLRV
jgi:hypothetical protein